TISSSSSLTRDTERCRKSSANRPSLRPHIAPPRKAATSATSVMSHSKVIRKRGDRIAYPPTDLTGRSASVRAVRGYQIPAPMSTTRRAEASERRSPLARRPFAFAARGAGASWAWRQGLDAPARTALREGPARPGPLVGEAVHADDTTLGRLGSRGG